MNINGKWMSEPEVQAYVSRLEELLRQAVADFKVIGKALDADCDVLINCDECPFRSGHYNCRSWNHQDEALKLIGGSENE